MAQTATAKRPHKRAEHASASARGRTAASTGTSCAPATSERAKRFYRDTIGWSFEAMPTPDGDTYWVAMQGGKPVAGLFPLDLARVRRRARELDVVPRRRRRRQARRQGRSRPAPSS